MAPAEEPIAVPSADTLRLILKMLATGEGDSRISIARSTGLSRSTVSAYIAALSEAGYIDEASAGSGSRGRPATLLALGPRAPKIVAIDLSLRGTRVAVYDLGLRPLAMAERSLGLDDGVATCIDVMEDIKGKELAAWQENLGAVVVAVPAAVHSRFGVVAGPMLSQDWGGFALRDAMAQCFGAPVFVANDANLIALGESAEEGGAPLLYAHVSHGFGTGIVDEDGNLHVGADGIAGDVGHAQLPGIRERRCQCGKSGCVGGMANLGAIVDDLGIEELGAKGHASEEAVAELTRRYHEGDPETVDRVRESARAVAALLAILVDFYNPNTLVLGGEVMALGDSVLSVVRSTVYENALPAATGRLVIRSSAVADMVLRGAAGRGCDLAFESLSVVSER